MRKVGRWVSTVALLSVVALLLTGCVGYITGQPTAVLKANPTGGDVPLAVTFDISGSSDPYGTIVGFELQFGDKSDPVTGTDITQPIQHTYADDGYYTTVLVVIDEQGRAGHAKVHITVTNPSPSAGFTSSVEGPTATFDACAPNSVDPASLTPVPESIIVYLWDFGDGTQAFSTDCRISHTYRPGQFTVTLTIFDDDGAIATCSATVNVLGFVYWGEGESDEIRRCSLGAGLPCASERVAVGQANPKDMAFDVKNGSVYWMEWSSGIWRCSTGGSLPCTPEHVIDTNFSYSLALDETNDLVYWTEYFSGKILRCSTSGPCTPEPVVEGQSSPYGVAVDEVNNLIYWAETDRDTIWRCSTASLPCIPQEVATDQIFLRDVAVDLTNNLVYWVSSNVIRRCSPATLPCAPQFVVGEIAVQGVAVTGNLVYWAEAWIDKIRRCSVEGGLPCTLEEDVATDQPDPFGIALGF